jgi:hypothetical protein
LIVRTLPAAPRPFWCVLVLSEVLEREGVFETERRRIADEANARRAEAARQQIAQQPRDEDGRVVPGGGTSSATTRSVDKTHRDREAKAAATGTNRGAVLEAGRVLR